MKKTVICHCSTMSRSVKTDSILDLEVANLKIAIDEQEFKSGEIGLKQMFDLIIEKKAKPITSQPPRAEFEALFKELLEQYDQVICVTPTGSLSGTYNGAVVSAKEIDPKNILVIDSMAIGMSETIIVEQAHELLKTTDNLDEIKVKLDQIAAGFLTYAVPGSLNYLRYSGRVDLKSVIIGAVLNINILIKVEDGKTFVHSKGRGYKSVLKEIAAEIDKYNVKEVYYSSILESQEKKDAILSLFEKKGLKVTQTHEADIVAGAHFGPDSYGFTFIR